MLKQRAKSRIFLSVFSLSFLLSSCGQSHLLPQNYSHQRQPIRKVSSGEVSTFAASEARVLYRTYDRNKDGKLDLNEVDASPQMLQRIDKDRNRQIESKEIQKFISDEVQRLQDVSQKLSPIPGRATPRKTPQTYSPVRTSTQFKPNQAELYIDGDEIFPMVFETLEQAQHTIQFDMFAFGGDIGMKVAQKLVERFNAGVKVSVMLDPNLGFVGKTKKQVKRVTDYLTENGVRWKTYPLHHISAPRGLLKSKAQIDHNKLITVDNRVAIMGGMNFFDFGANNHDLMFRINGVLAPELSDLMLLDWGLPGKSDFETFRRRSNRRFRVQSRVSARENVNMRLTKTDSFERSTKERLIDNVNHAKERIYISILEISDQDLTKALIAAYKRGVDVRVLMDAKDDNSQYVGLIPIPDGMPNLWPAKSFLKARLPVKWYSKRKDHEELHMKLALIDSETVMTGSTNFTTQAFTTFRETGFELKGDAIPKRLEQMFLEDWKRGKTIKKLSFGQKITAKVIEFMDKRYMGWW